MVRPTQRARLLEELKHKVSDCHSCPLHEERKQVVFGIGSADADIMLVGEAPGKNEDEEGIPFCGRSGKLLDKAFEVSSVEKPDVRIVNTVCCRPPGNRDPKKEEVKRCRKILNYQIKIVDPDVIVPMGKVASERIVGENVRGITKKCGDLRKVILPEDGDRKRVVVLCLHPSHYLYQGAQKRGVKEIAGVLDKAGKVVQKLDRVRVEKETEEVF